jgi:chloramphenicol 3-O-phosphotransferase
MSKDPDVASRFAGPNITRRGAIFPLRTKNNAVGVIDAKGKNAGDVQFGESGRPFRDMVRSGEYDSVAIKNTADEGDVYIALEPSNIRSQFAAFDPEYKGGNILGGTAATAIGAGALMSPNDASAAIEDVDIFEEEMPMSRRQRAQAQRERVLGASDPLLSGAQTANLLAGLTGVAGVADIFGEYPEFPEGDVSVGEMVLEGQRGPSLAENLGEGNYLSAGLQTLGIIPLVGLGARAAARALRSSNELSAEQLNEFGKVLERAIEEKAPNLREIVENHPVVVEAMAQIGRIPLTNEAKGFGSPEWLENRVFQFRKGDEVEEVIGYDDAVDRLYDQSKSLAWTDDGLTYPGPATRTGDKTAVIVLGPPASGKSSISNPIARKYDATIIDSDEAKKLLPEYAGGVGANAVHAESKAIIRQMEDIAIDEGDNLVIPTVGENAGKIRDRIDRYQNAGYNVQIVDVQVPAEEAAIRMFRRFYKTGRMIPTDHMNKVGNKPSATYDILREEGIADGFTRIDNTVPIDQPKPVLEDTGGLLEGTEIRLRGSGRNRGNDSGKPGVSGSQQKTARATQGEEKGIGSL